ncbi:MAG TPA: L,D-transpeptidase family protein [Gaiellaceae bacterium]|nr:L,D-transpeptidase family protein [Gaiellaceae bacterium]
MLRLIAALGIAAVLGGAFTPASAPTPVVPVGVEVGGIAAGGLSAEPLRTRLESALARPLTVAADGAEASIFPADLGVTADTDRAIGSALSATPGSNIALPVRLDRTRTAAVLARLAKRFDRRPRAARVIGANAAGPIFAPSRNGLKVDLRASAARLETALSRGATAVQLAVTTVPAKRTVANFGPAIVVYRAANTLRLYSGRKLVRTFRVATGQAIYPSPAGIWFIKDKQMNPWWYPPTYDSWAKGLKPVPPGPDNPLGTRWMGLNVPGVGIHGTDEPTSIGYSESHGCIRMEVPDAEWLFAHVHVGTQVVIL